MANQKQVFPIWKYLLLNIYVCARGLFAQRPFKPIAWIMFGMGIAHSTRAQSRKSSSLSRHGISFDVPPPPDTWATPVAPSIPAMNTLRPVLSTSFQRRKLRSSMNVSSAIAFASGITRHILVASYSTCSKMYALSANNSFSYTLVFYCCYSHIQFSRVANISQKTVNK